MKPFYVYKITRTNKEEGPKFYIGFKSRLRDNGTYFGSSKALQLDIKKYGIEFFEKIIIEEFKTKEEALQKEQDLLTQINAANNPLYYNLTNGNLKFSTAGKQYADFIATHPKNYLQGGLRTVNQQKGDKLKYTTRSDRRIAADKIHSKFMENFLKDRPELRIQYSNFMKNNNPSKRDDVKEKIRKSKLNKTKENNDGRRITSEKLKGNRNCEVAWLKFANMSEDEFRTYLQNVSQHPSVQGQAKTRRNKGLELIAQMSQIH